MMYRTAILITEDGSRVLMDIVEISADGNSMTLKRRDSDRLETEDDAE